MIEEIRNDSLFIDCPICGNTNKVQVKILVSFSTSRVKVMTNGQKCTICGDYEFDDLDFERFNYTREEYLDREDEGELKYDDYIDDYENQYPYDDLPLRDSFDNE